MTQKSAENNAKITPNKRKKWSQNKAKNGKKLRQKSAKNGAKMTLICVTNIAEIKR